MFPTGGKRPHSARTGGDLVPLGVAGGGGGGRGGSAAEGLLESGVGLLGNVQQPHQQLYADGAGILGLHRHIHLHTDVGGTGDKLGEAEFPIHIVAQVDGVVALTGGDGNELEDPDGGVIVGGGDEVDLDIGPALQIEAGNDGGTAAVGLLIDVAVPLLGFDGGLDLPGSLEYHKNTFFRIDCGWDRDDKLIIAEKRAEYKRAQVVIAFPPGKGYNFFNYTEKLLTLPRQRVFAFKGELLWSSL